MFQEQVDGPLIACTYRPEQAEQASKLARHLHHLFELSRCEVRRDSSDSIHVLDDVEINLELNLNLQGKQCRKAEVAWKCCARELPGWTLPASTKLTAPVT